MRIYAITEHSDPEQDRLDWLGQFSSCRCDEWERQGEKGVVLYPGIKEDVYVPFVKPDGRIRSHLVFGEDQIVVTIRPLVT